MFSTFLTASLLSVIFTTSLAQRNVTVGDTDPLIKYEGNVADAVLCKYENGYFTPPGGSGCYNVPSLCTASAAMGHGKDGAASLNFKGSAIYINSLLFDISPLYTVTLDGKSVDVDGVRPALSFICDTVFYQTGLDPNVEHNIRLSIKDLSPNRNRTQGDAFIFSLINFIYTTADNTATSPAKSSESSLEMPRIWTLISLMVMAASAFY